ncbi:putative molybdopterin converting factor, subunit 1 [Dictyocaulus viviparus]|uniref:Putative molybdopterin converting factor, subunit 1 n=1 Tax=Dictyocaulus viviparus TaxID=29172 RepID=A0A0D8XMF0_DICVI|nr:putative molybdopterin converting factor, subunit 1 [Dictyocaulus viviparus]
MTDDNVDVKVLFFGKARELMGCNEATARLPRVIAYDTLKDMIFGELFKPLNAISSTCVLAIDHKYANNKEIVNLYQRSEVAVIPPLSGG